MSINHNDIYTMHAELKQKIELLGDLVYARELFDTRFLQHEYRDCITRIEEVIAALAEPESDKQSESDNIPPALYKPEDIVFVRERVWQEPHSDHLPRPNTSFFVLSARYVDNEWQYALRRPYSGANNNQPLKYIACSGQDVLLDNAELILPERLLSK